MTMAGGVKIGLRATTEVAALDLGLKRAGVAACFAAALLLLAGQSAWASVVVDSFIINPNSISAGAPSELDLQLSVVPDSGFFNAVFTGGSVTLNSGFGPTQTDSILNNGTSTQSFSATFTYP